MRDGARAYFDHVNSDGGVHGRKIELQSLDDGYEPTRAVENTKRFIDGGRVFALFGILDAYILPDQARAIWLIRYVSS